MSYDTINGNRRTVFTRLSQRYYVDQIGQEFPHRVEGNGLVFNGIETDMVVSGVEVREITGPDEGDGVRVNRCSRFSLGNFSVEGARDEAIDLEDCEMVVLTKGDIKPGVDKAHDMGILSVNVDQLLISEVNMYCKLGRLPLLQRTTCTLEDCVIRYQNYATEIRGPGSRLNITGTTRWERVPGGPMRAPICIWATSEGQWDEPCIYVPRRSQDDPWPTHLVHVYHPDGERSGYDALFSDVPFVG